MKIGTLVGQEFLLFTDDEKKVIKQHIVDCMKKVFGDTDYNLLVNTDCEDGVVEFKIVNFAAFDGYPRRAIFDRYDNHYGKGDVFTPKYISIRIVKEKCYDEAEVGKFFEWEEGFVPELKYTDYSINLDVFGDFRRYKLHETYKGIGIFSKYSYGTELSDIDAEINPFIDEVKEMLYNSCIDRKCREYKEKTSM